MKNPELGRSKATWRDLFALGVLKDAKCILQQIESAAKNGDDALKWHLWIAFIVSYSKPFTANGDMGRISDGLIPQVFSDLHTAFIKTRDKLYAHTDPLESLDDGAQANQIFVIKAGDTIEIIPHTLRLDDAEIARAERSSTLDR